MTGHLLIIIILTQKFQYMLIFSLQNHQKLENTDLTTLVKIVKSTKILITLQKRLCFLKIIKNILLIGFCYNMNTLWVLEIFEILQNKSQR